MEYTEDENFHYLVIKSCQGEYYGFNLNIKKDRSYATKIVSPDERDDFMVVGWKVLKKRPKWICNADSWIDFISQKDNIENKQRVDNEDGEEEDEAVDHKEHFIDNKKMEEEEDNDEVEEEEEDEYEEEEKKEEDMEEEEEDKDEEEDKEEVEEETGEDEEEIPDKEVEQKILNKVLLESADPLPIRGGEPWQGDPADSILSSDQKKSAFKKVNDKKINKGSNSSTSNQKKKTPKKSKT
jgi:hypothetical protein